MFTSKKCLLSFNRCNHKWIKPKGYDTGIQVFNGVTKNKEPLVVKNKNLVSWYTCGPTVYDLSHIGHASCFVKLDIIQKILRRHFNLNLVTVMNITDVDDKIIAKSNASNIPIEQLTKSFEKEFWRDLETLEVRKPDCVLRVTENISLIVKFITKLMEEKKAYQSKNGTIYFDVQAYQNYGKLQSIRSQPSESVEYKKSSMDFALWKPVKSGEIYWDSPWGEGRPGWHIECSTLASYIFGSEIDIHAGGIDLLFPHHENEEAQCCAYHGKPQWVNYWLHTGHLHLKNCEKMSKSLKNTISVDALIENTTPQGFRMACLMSHYRKNMEFSSEFMKTASITLQNYKNFVNTCQNYLTGLIQADVDNKTLVQLLQESTDNIHKALVDDFNTPLIIQNLNDMIRIVNGVLHSASTDLNNFKSPSVIGVLNLVLETLDTLGINLEPRHSVADEKTFTEVMNNLNEFRQNIRQYGISNKDQHLLKLCDSVRSDLKKINITIKDFDKLSSWS